MITQKVFQVPFAGGGEGAFEADEVGFVRAVCEFAELFEGGVFDGFVPGEADEGAAAGVADLVDGVVGEIVTADALVVQLEAVFEQDLVEDGLFLLFVKADEVGGFFFFDVAPQSRDLVGLGGFRVGFKLTTWKIGLAELVDLESGIRDRLGIVSVAIYSSLNTFNC